MSEVSLPFWLPVFILWPKIIENNGNILFAYA